MPPTRRRRASSRQKASPTPEAAAGSSTATDFEIPQNEQMRIIEQSGILSKIPLARAPPASAPPDPLVRFTELEMSEKPGLDEEDAEVEEEDTLPQWVDSACDTFMFLIPFTSLFIVMDILVHKQYSQILSPQLAVTRTINFVPGLALLIHFTLRYPTHRLTRLLFFLLSAVGGSAMIYLVNKDSYLKIMRRCPALGTLWVYAVIRMELVDAVVSLAIVGVYCWYGGMKIIF